MDKGASADLLIGAANVVLPEEDIHDASQSEHISRSLVILVQKTITSTNRFELLNHADSYGNVVNHSHEALTR